LRFNEWSDMKDRFQKRCWRFSCHLGLVLVRMKIRLKYVGSLKPESIFKKCTQRDNYGIDWDKRSCRLCPLYNWRVVGVRQTERGQPWLAWTWLVYSPNLGILYLGNRGFSNLDEVFLIFMDGVFLIYKVHCSMHKKIYYFLANLLIILKYY
jgi:hypothetical protein